MINPIYQTGVLLCLAIAAMVAANSPCTAETADLPRFIIAPSDDSTRVEVQTGTPIGRIALWVPEAVMSERGACAIYPQGSAWRQRSGAWEQAISAAQSYGPGNYRRVSDDMIDFLDIDVPVDSPVEWTTRLVPEPGRVTFEVSLRNVGSQPIRRAGAAVCVKFLDADWWSDAATKVTSRGVVTLQELGRTDGVDPRFEAYLLRGERFRNPFYISFWSFNERRLDKPLIVSEHPDAGLCAVVQTERAYFFHCNFDNPCTDVMLAFGDLEPNDAVSVRGEVKILRGVADDLLRNAAGIP